MSIFKRKSSILVLIRELNPISDSYVINVRVLKIWDGFKGKGGSSLEMVLVDREGDRIHASVEKEFFKTFRKDLVEGQAITINTFKVVDYNNIIGQIIRVGHVENVVAQGKRRFRLKVSLRNTRLPNNRYILTPVEEEASKDSDEVLIEDFFGNSNSWYYIACKTCNKKVYPIPQKTSDIGPPLWKCVNCLKNVLEVTACFFLMLNVTDGDGGLAVFLLFDQHAQRLFKKTAEEVYEELDG
ncbi:hypothetical protein EUTSA_v10003070mg, partial [Eutrema salsugineum]